MLIGGDLVGGGARWEWWLNWEAKVNAIALADIEGAEAAGAVSDMGGIGVHGVHGPLSSSGVFILFQRLQHPQDANVETP